MEAAPVCCAAGELLLIVDVSPTEALLQLLLLQRAGDEPDAISSAVETNAKRDGVCERDGTFDECRDAGDALRDCLKSSIGISSELQNISRLISNLKQKQK